MEVGVVNNLYKQSLIFWFLKCHFIGLHINTKVFC